jgi:hypothetical protein
LGPEVVDRFINGERASQLPPGALDSYSAARAKAVAQAKTGSLKPFVRPAPNGPPPVDPGAPARSGQLELGNNFNKARVFDYPHREIYVEKPSGKGYWRLDGYHHEKEIVSRKETQLADIGVKTGVNYIKELHAKYPVNAKIANVRSMPPELSGLRLKGKLIVEVPRQVRPIPQQVLDVAEENNVTIRDVFGRVYRSVD